MKQKEGLKIANMLDTTCIVLLHVVDTAIVRCIIGFPLYPSCLPARLLACLWFGMHAEWSVVMES